VDQGYAPAPKPARFVTLRIGIHPHHGQLAAEVVDQAGGVAVGVGVDTDDGVDLLCQHSHRGCCSFQAAVVVAPAGVETPDGISVMSHAPRADRLLISSL